MSKTIIQGHYLMSLNQKVSNMPDILLMWVLPGLEGEATGKTGALNKGREQHFQLLLPQLL